MKFGCCASIDNAEAVYRAGFDYLEAGVTSLIPDEDDTNFAFGRAASFHHFQHLRLGMVKIPRRAQVDHIGGDKEPRQVVLQTEGLFVVGA